MDERIILLFFNLVVLLTSLIGGSVIIIGIIRYNALKLNKAVVTIILHLAVNDMMQAMFVVLPLTISIAVGSEGWILGEVKCDIFYIVKNICYTGPTLLTFFLSTCKMLTILYPFRARTWSKRRCTLSAGSGGLSLCCTIIDANKVYNTYNDRECNCYYCYTIVITLTIFILITSVTVANTPILNGYTYHIVTTLIIIILITTSVLILYKARKQAVRTERMRNSTLARRQHGYHDIGGVPDVFFPSCILNIVIQAGKQRIIDKIVTIVNSLLKVNVMANFYLYCIPVQSFKYFITSGMLSVERSFRVRGRQFLVSLRLPATRELDTTAISNVKWVGGSNLTVSTDDPLE